MYANVVCLDYAAHSPNRVPVCVYEYSARIHGTHSTIAVCAAAAAVGRRETIIQDDDDGGGGKNPFRIVNTRTHARTDAATNLDDVSD